MSVKEEMDTGTRKHDMKKEKKQATRPHRSWIMNSSSSMGGSNKIDYPCSVQNMLITQHAVFSKSSLHEIFYIKFSRNTLCEADVVCRAIFENH